jgi:hypothetical protein
MRGRLCFRAKCFSQLVLRQSEVMTKVVDQRRPLRGVNGVVFNHEIAGDVHPDHFDFRRDSSAELLQTGPGQFASVLEPLLRSKHKLSSESMFHSVMKCHRRNRARMAS